MISSVFKLSSNWGQWILNRSGPVKQTKSAFKNGVFLRWLRGILLKPASMANGSQCTLQNLNVNFRGKKTLLWSKHLSQQQKYAWTAKCPTVEFRVKLAQIGRDSSDEDLHCSICRADLKASLISQHRQHWKRPKNKLSSAPLLGVIITKYNT